MIVEEYASWQSGAEARAAERAASGVKTDPEEDGAEKKEGEDEESKPADAESEEEKDKRKKRKAQRAEKILSVLA